MIVSLDFETRSEANLKNVGAWKYSLSSSTDILCVAWACDDEPVQCTKVLGTQGEHLWALEDLAKDKSVMFSAFNAGFEHAIWNNILAERYGFPFLPAHRWRCSSATSMSLSLPRTLKDVGKALDLNTQKDSGEDGYYVMMKMCKPVAENRQDVLGKWIEDEESFEKLIHYCAIDVDTERELVKRIGFLPESEQLLWEIDLDINNYGVRLDIPLVEHLITAKDYVCDELASECKDKYGFMPSQVAKIKEYLTSKGVTIPTKKTYKKNKDTGEKELTDTESLGAEIVKTLLLEDIPESVKSLLRIRKEFATTSLAKAKAGMNHEVDGIVHKQFLYHGANTGRWSGRGIQLHNLPRGEFNEDWVDDDVALACSLIRSGAYKEAFDIFGGEMSSMELLKSCLRGMVIPREGNSLVVIDFSQIEARVLAWLAGQQDVLDAFKDGRDLYKFTASQIYQKDYEDVTKEERFIGKTASLALGYQGGENAFISMATNFGVKIEPELAKKIKDDWRDRNSFIMKFWYDLQKAATRTVKFGKTTQVGKIKFALRDGFLKMKLPCGRCLSYYDPRVVQDDGRTKLHYMGSDQQRGIVWGEVSTYGGKLAENATQAVSRDILANSIINMHKQPKCKVVGHVHDEIILETPTKEGVSFDDVRDVMLQLPWWAEGIPIDADGFKGQRYRK